MGLVIICGRRPPVGFLRPHFNLSIPFQTYQTLVNVNIINVNAPHTSAAIVNDYFNSNTNYTNVNAMPIPPNDN